ncbi:MAG TPA: helix-turn-helix domain-containing protein, partial [Candidatus Solibacter sp.]
MAKAARVLNRLAEVRKSRGVGAADLAQRVGVSRQTVYAIEAGTYVPNTQVALHLARELQVTVEELFSLSGESPDRGGRVQSDLLSAGPPRPGQPVRICQVGPRRVSIPVNASPYYLPEADGVIERAGRTSTRADLAVFADDDPAGQKRLVLAGCDPATGLLARMVEKISGVEVVSAAASSKLALQWLREGKVHIAGSHLEDARTG